MKTTALRCPKCAARKFELRIFKDEGVGSAKCLACERDHLILDSEDYWFDVIQRGYPRVKRCSCKGTAFRLKVDYSVRDDGEIDAVTLWSTCSSCKKTQKQLAADIDYAPTAHLIKRPLTYCKRIKVLYDLQELTLYVTRKDIANVVRFLVDRGCVLTAWLREGDAWVMRDVEADAAVRAALDRKDIYLRMYASLARLDTREADRDSKREASFWKRHEVVRISSPTHMIFGSKEGLLYYIEFANEIVDHDRVVPKSAPFRTLTTSLREWLGKKLVSWRGVRAFDSRTENVRLFGDEFSSNGRAGSRGR